MTKAGIFLDVDGTIIRWQSMHLYFEAMVAEGLFPKIASTLLEDELREWRERHAPFRLFISRMVQVFNERLPGVRVSDAIAVAERMIRREGARCHFFTRELLLAAQEVEMFSAFISGSPEPVVQALAAMLGAKSYLGTEYPHENGVYTKGQAREWINDKGAACMHLVTQNGINCEISVAVGDSESDIGMLELVRWPVCFNPNRELYHEALKRRWPIAVERKNVIYVVKKSQGSPPIQVAYEDILPERLAKKLAKRLERLNL